ncbi:MAG: ATP-dependent RecD-like DNA helicase [Limnochordales bacterium]|nr:ATP-dependent RecD-like DNA helicase [Limnochordales bacterium]
MAIVLEGSVEHITFRDPATLFTVARLRPTQPALGEAVVFVGRFVAINPGDRLRLWGGWETHPQYGRQFHVEEYQVLAPETLKGIEAYLASGRLQGVGPATARRLVKAFGLDTLRVLAEEPERVKEVEGIGTRRAEAIIRSFQAERALQQVMIFLQGHGVSQAYALRIFRCYGPRAVEVVRQNPYRLARDVHGIGFQIADRIARSLGFAADAEERLAAGLFYTLEEAVEAGHLFLPRRRLLTETTRLLKLEREELLPPVLDRLLADGELVAEPFEGDEGEAIYLRNWWQREEDVAVRLHRLLDRASALPLFRESAGEAVRDWEKREGISLSPEQRAAVEKSLHSGCVVITGGPGTGKTTLLRCLVALWQAAGVRFALAAPTGRAARRLAEATGCPARTLHRLLEFGRQEDGEGFGFRRNERRPLEVEAVVVDEVSMLDIGLADALLRALPRSSQLILVGDADQLPSVGPGQFLSDLIASGRVPVVRLTRVYRQAEASGIVVNAHRINQGYLPRWGFRDFFLVECSEPEQVAEMVVEYAARRIPAAFGWTGEGVCEAIQVLTPMRRGKVGVDELNLRLQEVFNPPGADKPELQRGSYRFRLGDKVMQVRNDYRQPWVRIRDDEERVSPGTPRLAELLQFLQRVRWAATSSDDETDDGSPFDGEREAEEEANADRQGVGTAPEAVPERGEGVFNGELGRIVAVDPTRHELAVLFDDGRLAIYSGDELDQLVLAYATTVHKSQGNEFPAVVFPVTFTAPTLMSRHLLYTAITRAKRVCVLVGEKRALAVYVRRGEQERRFTLLARRLQALQPRSETTCGPSSKSCVDR